MFNSTKPNSHPHILWFDLTTLLSTQQISINRTSGYAKECNLWYSSNCRYILLVPNPKFVLRWPCESDHIHPICYYFDQSTVNFCVSKLQREPALFNSLCPRRIVLFPGNYRLLKWQLLWHRLVITVACGMAIEKIYLLHW